MPLVALVAFVALLAVVPAAQRSYLPRKDGRWWETSRADKVRYRASRAIYPTIGAVALAVFLAIFQRERVGSLSDALRFWLNAFLIILEFALPGWLLAALY
ncbi:MAG TPA: hypothetical protein VGP82_05245 [Ktedonobacterales bacterium]|nr:hypothetical protein [Ktedonobacterales bacterium]